MEICVTSMGDNLDADVDPRFGRCQYFLIVDIDSMNVKSIANESAMASGGAGIQAAQTVAKVGVEVLVTGNVGPNAFQTLSAAGIKVFTGASGTVKEIVEKFKKGELKETEAASVGSHFGMGGTGRGFGRGR
jgi:predicted Fe-Mo cluster-binding NifX family protein